MKNMSSPINETNISAWNTFLQSEGDDESPPIYPNSSPDVFDSWSVEGASEQEMVGQRLAKMFNYPQEFFEQCTAQTSSLSNSAAQFLVSSFTSANETISSQIGALYGTVFGKIFGMSCCKHCWTALVSAILNGIPAPHFVNQMRQYHMNSYIYFGNKCEPMREDVALGMYVLLQFVVHGQVTLGFSDTTSVYGKLFSKLVELTAPPAVPDVQGNSRSVAAKLISGLSLILPFGHDEKTVSEAVADARDCTVWMTFVDKLLAFGGALFSKLMESLEDVFEDAPVDVSTWIDQVDQYDVIYKTDSGFVSQRQKLARYKSDRVKLFELFKTGKGLVKKFEFADKKNKLVKILSERLKNLKTIIAHNAGSFIGSEGKTTPLVMFFHGDPGVGKTLLCDHLFRDLFALLDMDKYEPSCDKYAFNPVNPYHDTYNYQKVFEIQDFFQFSSKDYQLNEVLNVMKIGDESAYAMNVAECGSKGQLFFCSDFVYITSNLDPMGCTNLLSSLLASPSAFTRRLDICCRVSRGKSSTSGFDKGSMIFEVGKKVLNYDQFLLFCARTYLDKKRISNNVMHCDSSFSEERIANLKAYLNAPDTPVAQAVERVTCKDCRDAPECSSCEQTRKSKNPSYTHTHRITLEHGEERLCSKENFEAHWHFQCRCTHCKKGPICGPCREVERRHRYDLRGEAIRTTIIQNKQYVSSVAHGGKYHVCPSECRGKPNAPLNGFPEAQGDNDYHGTLESCASLGFNIDHLMVPNTTERVPIAAWARFGKSNSVAVHVFGQTVGNVLSRRRLIVTPEGECLLKVLTIPDYISMLWKKWKGVMTKIARWVPMTLQQWTQYGMDELPSWVRTVVDKCVATSRYVTKFPRLMLSGVASTVKSLKGWINPRQYLKDLVKDCVFDCWKYLWSWTATVTLTIGTVAVLVKSALWLSNFSARSGDVQAAVGNISSGSATLRKLSKMPVKGPRLRTFHPSTQGDTQCNQLVYAARQNIGKIKGQHLTTHAVAVGDHVIMFPLHVVSPADEEFGITVYFPGRFSVIFKICEVPAVWCEENHVVVVDLSVLPEMKSYRYFPSLTKLICSENDLHPVSAAKLLLLRAYDGLLRETEMCLSNVKTQAEVTRLRYNSTVYEAPDMISYQACTQKGDCGAPVLAEIGGLWKMIGMHVGLTAPDRAYGSFLTTEWVGDVLGALKVKRHELVIPVQGVTDLPLPSETAPVSFEGILIGRPMHQPTNTTLLHSPLYDGRNTSTLPAVLKGKVDSEFGKISPLYKSFVKWYKEPVYVDPMGLYNSVEWLFKFYDADVDKRVLTTSEAVFGVDNNSNLSAIDSSASVGYPWCLTSTRKQLIDFDQKEIKDNLLCVLESSLKSLKDGEHISFVCCDMLKDERLPVEKVNEGKTRIFTVMPIHINILLKQLFGTFVAHVTALHNEAPVKVGMSIASYDIQRLAEYLGMNTQTYDYICGDISSSDRVIPYEVFSAVVQRVNQWYGDEWSVARTTLAADVFQPYHLVGNNVVRTYQGMPSGCYLTSVFNSLAYAVLLHQAAWDNCAFDPVIATFGDDHVLAVEKVSGVKGTEIQQWFEQVGIGYTSTTKTNVVATFPTWEGVEFLKRSFVFDKGWRLRFSLEHIEENMMWLHNSVETRKWTDRLKADVLLQCACSELVQYDVKTWDKFMEKWQPTLSRFSLCYDRSVFQEQFLGKLAQKDKSFPLKVAMPLGFCETYGEVCPDVQGSGQEEFDPTVWEKSEGGACWIDGYGHLPYDHHYQTMSGQDFHLTICSPCGAFVKWVRRRSLEDPDLSDDEEEPQIQGVTNDGRSMCEDDSQTTVLGGSQDSEQVEGLVKFEDTTMPSLLNVDPGVDNLLDAKFEWPRQYCKTLERSYVIDQFQLDSNVDMTVLPLRRYWVQGALFSQPFIRDRVGAASFVKFDLHVEVRVIATKFHYGGLIGLFRPMYLPTQVGDLYLTNTEPKTMVQLQWSSWDSLFSASTCPHQVISLTGNSTTSFHLKWPHAVQYLKTNEHLEVKSDCGVFDLYNITNVYPTQMDSPEIIVFATLKNVRLFGYSTISTAVKDCVARVSLPTTTLTWTQIDIPVAQGDEDEVEQKNQSVWRKIPQVVGDVASGVIKATTWFTSLLDFFGLSKPRDPAAPHIMARNFLPVTNSIGKDPSVSFAYDASNQLHEMPSNPEEMLISRIAERPMYLSTTVFRNKGQFILYSLTPSMGMALDWQGLRKRLPELVYTPAGFIASTFRFFRTDVILTLRIYASMMNTVRFQLKVHYDVSPATGEFNPIVASWVFEGNGDFVKCFHIPYMATTQFKAFGSPLLYANLSAITDVVTPEVQETRPVAVSAWVSFTGLQVHTPYTYDNQSAQLTNSPVAVSYDAPSSSVPTVQGDELKPPMVGKVLESAVANYLPTDIPTSILHLCKRPSNVFPLTQTKNVLPDTGAILSLTSGTKYREVVVGSFFVRFSHCFVLYRSSFNLALFDRPSTNILTGTATNIGSFFSSDVNDAGVHYAPLSTFLVYDSRSVHIPYRSSVPYTLCPTILGKNDGSRYVSFSSISRNPELKNYGVVLGSRELSVSPSAADDLQFFLWRGIPAVVWHNVVSN